MLPKGIFHIITLDEEKCDFEAQNWPHLGDFRAFGGKIRQKNTGLHRFSQKILKGHEIKARRLGSVLGVVHALPIALFGEVRVSETHLSIHGGMRVPLSRSPRRGQPLHKGHKKRKFQNFLC